MRFSPTKEHKEFYHKNLYIEFEDVLSDEEISQLRTYIHNALSKRDSRTFKPSTPLSTYDLSFDDPIFKKFVTNKRFALLAREFVPQGQLRYAFDWYIHAKHCGNTLYGKPTPLREGSCLKEVACGLIFRLAGAGSSSEGTFVPSPSKAGNLMIVHSTLPLDFESVLKHKDEELFVIAYALDKLYYSPNDRDPAEPFLKKKGYAFGDFMKEDTHPNLSR